MLAPKFKSFAIGLVLFGISAAVYFDAFQLGYVNFDDHLYVAENRFVAAGLVPSSVKYAWTTFDSGNWIPVTWLSLELDATLFGVSPLVYHRTNVLLHATNVVLLFVALFRMTGALGKSAIVALFFAVHPLHVESVAWISERKDVLSTMFLLLVLLAYERYASQPTLNRWLWIVAFMVCGLLSKSMLVTLPILLLLLDWWPLQRLGTNHEPFLTGAPDLATTENRTIDFAEPAQPETVSNPGVLAGTVMRYPVRSWRELVIEKVPLFGLSLLDGLVTIKAQGSTQALTLLSHVSIRHRIGNAAVAYCWYLWKTLWPAGLRVFYEHPGSNLNWWLVFVTAVLLVGVSAAVYCDYRGRDRRTVCWSWFVIALMPVIGILQVGGQAYADRYAYIPHIGLFTLIVWQSDAWLQGWRVRPVWGVVVAVCVAVFWSIGTVNQVEVWRDGLTLWSQVIRYEPNNAIAHGAVATCLLQENRLDEAARHIEKSFELGSIEDPRAILSLGRVYERRGDWEAASEYYEWALRSSTAKPSDTKKEAMSALEAIEKKHPRANRPAVVTAPRPSNPEIKLGMAAARRDDMVGALDHFEAAIKADPENPDAYNNAALAMVRLGRTAGAEERQKRASELVPDNPSFHVNLAAILAINGKTAEAQEHYREALRLRPGDVEAQHRLKLLVKKPN